MERALAAVAGERAAKAAWHAALPARDAAVRALFDARLDSADRPGEAMGPTELARLLGMHPSTVRGITRDAARAHRTAAAT